jgi:hypothetical protein
MITWQDGLVISGFIVSIIQLIFLPTSIRIRLAIMSSIFAICTLLLSFIPSSIRFWLFLMFIGIAFFSLCFTQIKNSILKFKKKLYIYIARKLDTKDLKEIYAERIAIPESKK